MHAVGQGAQWQSPQVVHVQRLANALHCLQEQSFDVILLDLTLPDSHELESLVPLSIQAPSAPIVVLTNTNDDELAIAAVRHGAQDYLVKRQINAEVLTRSLHYAIERKHISEALREANECLEMRVQERTTELANANNRLKAEILKKEQAFGELQRIQEELQRSNTELRQFAYVASHDLQEPLRTISSFVQLLARRYQDQLDANAQDYIDYVVDGTKRMQELIQALLGYSRVGRSTRELEPIACDSLLQLTLRRLGTVITDHAATVTYDSLPRITADPVQLGQLFQNLIENAIKYRQEAPPQIHISATLRNIAAETYPQSNAANSSHHAELPTQEWVFAVQDNGIGIEAEYFERIFLIFQRLHTRSEYSGTGIGLAICQKIVERHSGKIWVESELGKGSTFYFTIPVIAASMEVQPQAEQSAAISSAT